MCYQSRLKSGARLIDDVYGWLDDPASFNPSDVIMAFDYPKTPVVTNINPDGAQFLQWGLLPKWAKTIDHRKYTLNAKVETLHEKPSYKDVVDNRCLIIADGFYEWRWLTRDGKSKQKYCISVKDTELFTFAGLWSQWQNKSTGEVLNTYTIVTTAANEMMNYIHNTKKRMPLVLKKEDEQAWLEATPPEYFVGREPELLGEKV